MNKSAGITEEPLRIGALAGHTGCSIPTIRYYEQIGLIPAARRRSSGQRVYETAAVPRLVFIRRCRELGFGIEPIRAFLSLAGDEQRDCVEARAIAQAQLRHVRSKMVELMTLERTLAGFIDVCSATCAGSPAPGCTILKDIASSGQTRSRCCG